MKCVFCGRQNQKTQTRRQASGEHLRYILDDVDGTYHCNECDDIIRYVIQNYDYYQFYGRQTLTETHGWIKETESFEKGLDLNWTEDSLIRDIYKEDGIPE